MYLTFQTSLNWMTNNTVTNVKTVKFDQSNSPCLAFAFYDIVTDRYLKQCPSDLKISFSDNGKNITNTCPTIIAKRSNDCQI